jgi:hypothetical protein
MTGRMNRQNIVLHAFTDMLTGFGVSESDWWA